MPHSRADTPQVPKCHVYPDPWQVLEAAFLQVEGAGPRSLNRMPSHHVCPFSVSCSWVCPPNMMKTERMLDFSTQGVL